MSQIKASLLGMSLGTAASRLRKSLMFNMAKRLEENFCHRCGGEIETEVEFSVDHKEAWQTADDPVAAFFDLDNISFSHLLCNIKAGARPHKRFACFDEMKRENNRRNAPKRVAARKAWRARQREAGLPYT